MSSAFPSRRPSLSFAQIELCQICNRPRDNQELRESVAHPGLLACSDHPEEFYPGHREYLREGMQVIYPSEVGRREEPFGAPLGIWGRQAGEEPE
jgi:hypothetical protein